jgi:hypothetical protein
MNAGSIVALSKLRLELKPFSKAYSANAGVDPGNERVSKCHGWVSYDQFPLIFPSNVVRPFQRPFSDYYCLQSHVIAFCPLEFVNHRSSFAPRAFRFCISPNTAATITKNAKMKIGTNIHLLAFITWMCCVI